jgi:hypothetical protein
MTIGKICKGVAALSVSQRRKVESHEAHVKEVGHVVAGFALLD